MQDFTFLTKITTFNITKTPYNKLLATPLICLRTSVKP